MLDRLDIEDVISSYISLKRNGRTLKGLCPFHNEKTPSFTVYPDTRSFYCFGCGASGDVISFIMRMDNLDYVEAVKTCAERAGMTMPEDGYDDTLAKLRVRILNANREAARFYNSTLWSEDGKAGLEYFQKRHLPKNIINHFGLGYAPDSWQKLSDHLKALGFTEQELIHANLAKRSGKTGRIYDAFRNRVMFPVMDLRGNVIAFSGRVLDDSKPKYINTEDTPVYKKGNGVYALNFAKNTSSRQLILAEGQMDVIALHEFGFTNAIATLGTALTKEQANLIARYADELLICYDNDDAGKKATEKALNIFGQTGIKLKVINMSGGKDADEILRTYGRERFAGMLSASENDVEYRLDREKANYNILTDDGKVRFLSAAAAILASCTEVEKEIYSNRLSSEFGISKTSFDTQIQNESRKVRRQKAETRRKEERRELTSTFEDKNNPEKQNNLRATRAEEVLIASLMRNNDFYPKIKDEFSPDDFVTQFNRRIITVLIELIDGGFPTELSMFASEFTPDEMNSVARISFLSDSLANTLRECRDCIRVLKEEKEKISSSDSENMSDEDYLNAFLNLKKREENKNGSK